MHVWLSRPPSHHSAYAQLVAAPPGGVDYRWPPTTEHRPFGWRGRLATAAVRALAAPHLRPLKPPAETELVHACQDLLVCSIPWIVDIEHGSPFVGTSFHRWNFRWTRKLVAASLGSRTCKAILAWTQTAAEGLRSWFSDRPEILAKLCVVSPAIQSVPTPVKLQRVQRLLFVANAPSWNFVIKGGREVLESVRRLVRQGRSLSLTIVGPVQAEVLQQWRAEPYVEFRGPLSATELASCYADSDVFVMPSFSDTFGMVYLEAMACGLPVVALDRPFTRDIVEHGRTGLLVSMDSGSIQWVDAAGHFRCNSGAFIQRMLTAAPDETVISGLEQHVARLQDDPQLARALAGNAKAEVASGRFSIQGRNQALQRVYEAATTLRGSG